MASTKFQQYGLWWENTTDLAWLQLDCIRRGGLWKKQNGQTGGAGNFVHFKEFIRLIWPDIAQHRWFDFFLKHWLEHKFVGVIGPASSGKTCDCALLHLVDYYAFPHSTTTLFCSTTKERLEDRGWGEIKKYHREAKYTNPWLPGNLIEGRMRIVTSPKHEAAEGRDFRNGIIGVPMKQGGTAVGMSSFIGIKNRRVRLAGDELQLLPKTFLDSTVNLDANQEFKCTGLGNPSQATDCLGLLCEPSTRIGGWESGIDQTPKTKFWETRWPDGICIQLPGSDSPNLDVPANEPVPFPYLITRKKMEEDATHWGKDDWHYMMFDEGRLPRGQGSNRVITRRICEKGGAMLEPNWRDTQQTEILALDAAFGAPGGDRCVLMRLKFGKESSPDAQSVVMPTLLSQSLDLPPEQTIIALVETKVIPITGGENGLKPDDAEDQIVKFIMLEAELHRIPPEHFFFDSGMRTALVLAFARLWSPQVQGIDSGGTPSDRKVSEAIDIPCKEYYKKRITEFWYTVRLIVEAGQFRGMTEEVMLEGCQREWTKVDGNKIEVESKKDMKEKTGRSPDLFDCLAIGCEGARQLGFIIKKLGAEPDGENESASNWKREAREKARKFWRSGTLQTA
jgi:hypothetical protein